MEALKFSFRNKCLELRHVDKPTLDSPNDILIQIAYAGICGTDLHILAGEYPCRQTADVTLGHELSGVIVEVGKDVIHFEEGDRVAVDPNMGCKRCAFCHAGTPHFCKVGCDINTIGIYKDGAWAQYVVCLEEQVYKLPPNLCLEHAVFTESMSCLIHGWDIVSPISVGQSILLIGAGIIGALWASALHLQGHRNVTVCDAIPKRLEFLRKLNTGYSLTTPEQLRKNAHNAPENYMFDVAIDCCGSPPAIEQGISLLNFGGKFCVFGVAPPMSRIHTIIATTLLKYIVAPTALHTCKSFCWMALIRISPFDIFYKELKILGVKVNPFTFPKALELLATMGYRYLSYNTLGVKTFALSEFKEAVETLKKGAIVKAVFKM